MRKAVVMVLCGAVAIAALMWGSADSAMAIPPFKKEFDTKYSVKEDSAIGQAKCNVCHKGTKKTDRNAYGRALAELLDKKEDAKNPEKIQKALDTVAKLKSNGEDSPTFGQLIEAGKLPATE